MTAHLTVCPWCHRARWHVLALVVLSVGLYLPNLNDYFLGDDFDLIGSFYGKPPRYFLDLLWSNESGDAWKSWGIDPALGRGYLRPLKIWLLKLDLELWGTNPLGFHLTSTAFFAGIILLVWAILGRTIPQRPHLALAGAYATAVHPIFAELIPFVTAREEIVATFLGLASFLAFLRVRLEGRSAAPFHLFYALALLTKESGVVFLALPLSWDLAHGRLLPPVGDRARELLRTYAPAGVVLVGYFALRWMAFGNFAGGDGEPTHFLSAAAFVGFHARLWRSLFDPTLISVPGVPGALAIAGTLGLGVVGVVVRSRRVSARRWRDLLCFGPLWYLSSTSILYGVYFAVHHNLLAVIGLVLFATILLDALLMAGVLQRPGAWALGLALGSTALFLPPTLTTIREFDTASEVVRGIRASIEAQTAALPPGSSLALRGVPQWVLPPYFFGWGLLSALEEPFTKSDLANRSTVIDARNLELNRSRRPVPERYDLVLEFDLAAWVPAWMEARQRQRLSR